MVNTILLNEKIDQTGLKRAFIASSIGITYICLWKKINNKTEFKLSEIKKICKLLSINYKEREAIFFYPKCRIKRNNKKGGNT